MKRAPSQRWEALDDLRGLAVLVMVPVNVAAGFIAIPRGFKHAPGRDLPFRISSCRPSYSPSAFRRRFVQGIRTGGFGRTFLHALVRNPVLFAFGSVGILLVDRGNWEILQMLGARPALFFFLLLPPWARLGAAVLLLAGVEI